MEIFKGVLLYLKEMILKCILVIIICLGIVCLIFLSLAVVIGLIAVCTIPILIVIELSKIIF